MTANIMIGDMLGELFGLIGATPGFESWADSADAIQVCAAIDEHYPGGLSAYISERNQTDD